MNGLMMMMSDKRNIYMKNKLAVLDSFLHKTKLIEVAISVLFVCYKTYFNEMLSLVFSYVCSLSMTSGDYELYF